MYTQIFAYSFRGSQKADFFFFVFSSTSDSRTLTMEYIPRVSDSVGWSGGHLEIYSSNKSQVVLLMPMWGGSFEKYCSESKASFLVSPSELEMNEFRYRERSASSWQSCWCQVLSILVQPNSIHLLQVRGRRQGSCHWLRGINDINENQNVIVKK
jgi:hypothetical protein